MNIIKVLSKQKYVEYASKKLYTCNNLDSEKLNEKSIF